MIPNIPFTPHFPLLYPTTLSCHSMEPTSLPTFGETLPSNETDIEVISVAQVTPLSLSLSYIYPLTTPSPLVVQVIEVYYIL